MAYCFGAILRIKSNFNGGMKIWVKAVEEPVYVKRKAARTIEMKLKQNWNKKKQFQNSFKQFRNSFSKLLCQFCLSVSSIMRTV